MSYIEKNSKNETLQRRQLAAPIECLAMSLEGARMVTSLPFTLLSPGRSDGVCWQGGAENG